MGPYGENSNLFRTHNVMSHFLAWKKHYRPKYNYLTLAFCVLTVTIEAKNVSVPFCLVKITLVKIVVYELLALLSTVGSVHPTLLKSSAERL